MKILMIGVDKKRTGGMWTVSNNYITNKTYNKKVLMHYVSTSTSGNFFRRIMKMIKGYICSFFQIIFFKPEIVHIHMAEKGSVIRKSFIIKMAKKRKCKILVHMHAGPFMDWYNTLNNRKKIKIKKMFDNIDCLLVLGKYFKKQMKEIIDDNKIKVLYNGIDIPKINYYLANKNKKEFFLYSGRINELKGVFDILESIKNCDDKLPSNIKFVFCGSDETGRFKSTVENLKIENRIIFEGWVSTKKMQEYYKKSKCLILPSYSEGLSMTIIEAMSYGLPIITTNITTNPEILDGICYLVEAGNKKELSKMILEYSSNENMLKNISEKEYKRVNELFSIEIMIENTLKYYEELHEK